MVFFPGGRFWFLGNRKQCPARKAINNELNSGCLLLVFAMLFCKPFLTSFAFNWPFCHTGMTETLHFLCKRPFVSQPLTDLPIYSPFKFCQHMSLIELVVKQISPLFFTFTISFFKIGHELSLQFEKLCNNNSKKREWKDTEAPKTHSSQ